MVGSVDDQTRLTLQRYGTYSVSDSINNGLNLEMPGPARWREAGLVQHSIKAHKIDPRTIDQHAIEILTWIQNLVKLNPDLVYAPPADERTRTEDKDADAKQLRELAAQGIVLLKNENDILPIQGKRKVAVIGPNAKDRVLTGGGSAQLASAWSQTPWEGLEGNKPKDVQLEYALGAYTAKFLPILDENFSSSSGDDRFDLLHYALKEDGSQGDKAVVQETWHKSNMFMADFHHPDLGSSWYTEIKTIFTSPVDGEYEFGLAVTGHGKLWVDDELVVDTKGQKRGTAFFNCGTEEKKGKIKVQKGKVSRYQRQIVEVASV